MRAAQTILNVKTTLLLAMPNRMPLLSNSPVWNATAFDAIASCAVECTTNEFAATAFKVPNSADTKSYETTIHPFKNVEKDNDEGEVIVEGE